MTNLLELEFTSGSNAVFMPNQVLAGTVELRVTKALKARGLRLAVKGKAECKWIGTTGAGKHERTKTYTGKETYLNLVDYLFGSPNGNSIEIHVGVHAYNFQCLLPNSLPYSFEGTKGFIRYMVEATVEIPWGFNYEIKKPFIVVRHDDLNLVTFPNYRLPCEVEKIKTFQCFFWKSSPLVMTMRVPKTGFGLGEQIPIHIVMINRSKTNIRTSEFTLVKIEQYNSHTPPKSATFSSVLTSKTAIGVAAGDTVNFVEMFTIPRGLPTSNGRFCKILKIRYFIKFKAKTAGFRQSPEMGIFIAIGNVGIEDTTEVATPVPPQIHSVSPTAPYLCITSTLDDPPPSFEEATRDQAPFCDETQLLNNCA